MELVTWKEPNAALRRALVVALVLILIGTLPLFGRMFVGSLFLPSTNWIAQSFWPAMACAAYCAIVPSVAVVRGRIRDGGDRKSFKYLFLLAFTPALCGTLGFNAISGGGAMLYTWAVAKPIELTYVVKKARPSVDRKCRNPIVLQGLPILANELCGFSEEFVTNLSPGQTLVVSGNGSPLGVFVSKGQVARKRAGD